MALDPLDHDPECSMREWLPAGAHGNPGFPQFLTVLPLPAISSAIGAGSSARANCYGAKRL
jgi:hypothetical protein